MCLPRRSLQLGHISFDLRHIILCRHSFFYPTSYPMVQNRVFSIWFTLGKCDNLSLVRQHANRKGRKGVGETSARLKGMKKVYRFCGFLISEKKKAPDKRHAIKLVAFNLIFNWPCHGRIFLCAFKMSGGAVLNHLTYN